MAKNTQIIAGGMGRPFTLGMLYNAPKDELVPGIAVWDSETLKNSTLKQPLNSSNFNITASDSTKDSSFNLNVDASLKLSFMSGLVEVGGSANYLNDQKEFKNQSRVVLQYKATTHFEQLSLTSDLCEKVQNREMIEKGLATHVVTGIEYGANAFFVFDSQKLETGEVQDVKGQMEATIKKIPECGIEGEANLHLTDEEKKLVQTFSVKFYGDFLLPSNPATFDAAVQTYVDLPKLLLGTENDKTFPVNTVPVRVWMLSLDMFDPKAAQSVQGISVGLVIGAENVLEDLANIKMRCNDSLSVSAVGKFPQLHHQLSTYHKLCHYYTLELQRQMAEKCPAIREGKEEESVLRSLFDDRDKSPFSQEKLTKWLNDKEREINVIQSCLDIMKGIPVLSTQAEVDRFVLSPENAECKGYIFTSLENTEPFLQEMETFLDTLKQGKQGKEYEQLVQMSAQQTPWYYTDDILTMMREMASDFVPNQVQFVAAIPDAAYIGAAIYNYKNGVLLSRRQKPRPRSTESSPKEVLPHPSGGPGL